MFLNKKNLFLAISICIVFFFLTYNDVKSNEVKIISGQAIVTDGDTIKVNNNKIRFSGIDTPETYYRGKRQKCIFEKVEVYCGYWSKIVLIQKIGNNNVSCIKEDKPDQYKRILAECFVNGESLSKYLVRSGYAFAYRKYSKKFVKDEEYAKANKLGLWQSSFEFPWDFRKKLK
jgi:endonuclease YncB( thermonuclease family)